MRRRLINGEAGVMMQNLDQRLDAILAEANTHIAGGVYQNVLNAAVELEQARQRVTDLERDVHRATDRLCGGLALGIRHAQPSLHVQLGSGTCRVGYLKKSLTFRPDIHRRTWVLESSHPRFASRFRRHYGHLLYLSDDLTLLADGIADFFTRFYRTLGEDAAPIKLEGVGSVVLTDSGGLPRRISLGQLSRMVQVEDKHLQTIKVEQW